MGDRRKKNLLFLCTGNFYRSRFAEVLFNGLAGRMGLPWEATSRALGLERGLVNIGPMSVAACRVLEALGHRAPVACARFPQQATDEDMANADRIIALKQAEHQPMVLERFPSWADKIEYWHIDDVPGVLPEIERQMMTLLAQLMGGGDRADIPAAAPAPEAPAKKPAVPVVRLGRETKGRRGKGVTIVSDVPLDEAGLLELAATLKQRCGTGGTVKDGQIEIQGDQRSRLTTVLESLGYRVKHVGG